jgi:hypothetical protein
MVRRQIQLSEAEDAAVRRAANRRRISISAFVRAAVRRALDSDGGEARQRRLLSLVGKYRSTGPGDVSEKHDEYLADAFDK